MSDVLPLWGALAPREGFDLDEVRVEPVEDGCGLQLEHEAGVMRALHVPSGIAVRVGDRGSQHRNALAALEGLRGLVDAWEGGE